MRGSRWLPLSLYSAVAIASLYPLSIHPHNTIPHVGDALENAYLIAWNAHQLFHDPLSLYDLNAFYPASKALTFTDHRFLPAWIAMPVVLATGNSILAYNVAVLLACLLAAWGARSLGLFLGLGALGAWAAGALYAFHTYQLNEIPRLQIVFHGFLPLMIKAGLELLRQPAPRAAWRTAGFMLLLGLCANYWLLYGCLVLAVLISIALILQPRTTLSALQHLLLPALVAFALYLPIAIPYLASAATHGFHQELPTGIDLQHYFSTLPSNVIYGHLLPDVVPRHRPHFVGFVALALGLAAVTLLVILRHRGKQHLIPQQEGLPARLWVPCAAGLGLLFVLLSLGKDLSVFGQRLGPGPYRLLYEWVPGFHLVRFPERLGLVAMLFLGLLAGFSVTVIRRAGWVVPSLLLAGLLPLEHLSPAARGDTRIPVGDEVPEVYRWLADVSVRALAEVPTHGEKLIRKETLEMYFSSFHFKPIVHGYATYPPAETARIRRLVVAFPSAEALAGLRAVGIDTLVVHFPPEAESRPYATHVLRRPGFYGLIRRLERWGEIRRLASFSGPTARIPGGTDVVYRF